MREGEALKALHDALDSIGLGGVVHDGGAVADRPTVVVGEERLQVAARAVVTTAAANELAHDTKWRARSVLVVADRISREARATLRAAGFNFLDRQGHLRLVVPPVVVDTELPRTEPPRPMSEAAPLGGAVPKEVAIALLAEPPRSRSVGEVAELVKRPRSSAHAALARLRQAGLVTSSNMVAGTELFWELAATWRSKAVALAGLPEEGSAIVDPLELGLSSVGTAPGWALTDTQAAAAWGAPLVVTADYPPDFYLPSEAALRRAVRSLGRAASFEERACTVRLAPVPLVAIRRYKRPGTKWPLAERVVVALDLAQDRARGRDVLREWHPEGLENAW